jgi:hypothetical protein
LEVSPSIRIVHLEDDPHDAALVQSALEAGGISCAITCVQTREEFLAELDGGDIDLILSDSALSAFDGMAALRVARARCPFVPLIFVCGTTGEQQAIDSLKSGATDYILKDRLSRIVPAVRRAMREVEERAGNRRTEEALRTTEQRLGLIFSESILGIALVGVDGRPVLTNAALQKMLGYTDEELRAMPFDDFTHFEDIAADRALYEELIHGTRKNYQMEKRYVRKNGEVIWARLSVSVQGVAKGRAEFAIAMVEDITERRNLQAQFIEAQKMEVVGKLAGGVAHDFNNILFVIMGSNDLLDSELAPNSSLKKNCGMIRQALDRAVGLTRQLLVFSRKQTVQFAVLDINTVVEEMEKMLRRLVDENIALTIIPGKQIGHIKADSGYIGQVLMNLAVNARDAMPDGGRLIISTSNLTLDEPFARKHTGAIPGNYVMLSVNDTGTGMTPEVRARIFEAFFTTKASGQGTGLGLATCQTIVQQCGGYIEVESEVAKGTTFKIYFPRVDQPLDATASLNHDGPVPGGTETLLLVEDEPDVRHLAHDVLETLGYVVIRASNGQHGLHLAAEHKGSKIALVITDVVMPQMGGIVMAEWLRTIDPHLKILFTSGYTDDTIALASLLKKGIEFLPKPYTPATLARKVRQMLDASATEPPRP